MENVLVINAAGGETRVALVENGHIAEYYLDRKRDRGIVGNIYKGKVVRVLPGMQAAFVDIGLDKAAFLYVADVFYDPDFSDQEFDLTEGEHADHESTPSNEQIEELEAKAQADRAALATEAASHRGQRSHGPRGSAGVEPAAGEASRTGRDRSRRRPPSCRDPVARPCIVRSRGERRRQMTRATTTTRNERRRG